MQKGIQASTKGHASTWRMRDLIFIFTGWKAFLILIACSSPGPGYDTSSQILLDQHRSSNGPWFARAVEHAVLRLTRWDGIYFASSSTRGHVYEQEWAFSWVLAKSTSAVSRAFLSPLNLSPILTHALAGVIVSHVSHLLAVLALYRLVVHIIPDGKSTKVPSSSSASALQSAAIPRKQIAFATAALHIVSPGGLFLSTPYAESPFTMFNFLGMLSYVYAVKARQAGDNQISNALWTVAAGASFALASTVRSNGLLSGTIFVWDAIQALFSFSTTLRSPNKRISFLATLAAGIILAVGFALPQTVAYMEYCTNGNTRPWCNRIPPSIYTLVQEHYWGVGFLKYWTPNNIPLFALATPMLVCLVWTAYVALFKTDTIVSRVLRTQAASNTVDEEDLRLIKYILPRLALPQLILAIMAATSFHVQIINRISSGYPVWYISLAIALYNPQPTNVKQGQKGIDGSAESGSAESRYVQWAVRAMVVYATVQGGLYAAFLPPA